MEKASEPTIFVRDLVMGIGNTKNYGAIIV